MYVKTASSKIALTLFVLYASVFSRVFFTGSNPALSSFAFPQDIFLLPGDRIGFFTTWESFPWWGDIDERESRPNKEYVLTGEKTDSSQHLAKVNEFGEQISLRKRFSEKFTTNFNLSYKAAHHNAEASGYTEGNNPYTYEEKHAIRDLYLRTILATYYKTLPIGFSIGLGLVSTSDPDFTYRLDGQSSDRLIWGWRGNDYENQNQFAIGSLFKLDLQAAGTFSRYKIGTRFRLYTGSLDNHTWDDASQSYEITPKKIHNYTFRLYGIYNWYKREKFKFNTTILTRFTAVDSIGVRPEDDQITDFTEKAKIFVFQINPNINVYPWDIPMTFIDAAILCNYEHMRYDFRRPDGNYMSTYWWSIEDYSWEDFSYGWENFFEIALDIYAQIPVFGRKNQNASVGISALVWRRYKWMNKYFLNWDQELENVRKNFDKEMWLNAVFILQYKYNSHIFRLYVGQPLIYSLSPRTNIYNDDDILVGGKTTEKMWLSQSGFKLGFSYSIGLEKIFRYRPYDHPDNY